MRRPGEFIRGAGWKYLYHFPREIQVEPLVDRRLEVGFFLGHFIRHNVSEDLARGFKPVDLRSHFVAVVAQKAEQILQVQNVFLLEALQQVPDLDWRAPLQLHSLLEIDSAPSFAPEHHAIRTWF